MRSTDIFAKGILLAMATILLTGCPKKPATPAAETETTAEQQNVEEKTEASAPQPEAPSVEIGTEWITVAGLDSIRFETNMATLSPDARNILKKNAVLLKAVVKREPTVQVRLEGHCDERGTLEYNMALGQRRANALRDYYASLGLPKKSLATISYGEEKPVCSDSTPECWATNRRGETTLKSDAPVKIPLDQLPSGR